MTFTQLEKFKSLHYLVARRIVILDGAMGTMIQQLGFGEAEFRGSQFADHPRDLKGCNDLLSITQPEAITAIHRQFLEAGADIISTNTFNANAISMADYGLVDRVREINAAAVACAKRAIEEFRRVRETHQDSGRGQGTVDRDRHGSGFSVRVQDSSFRHSSFIYALPPPASRLQPLHRRLDRPDKPHGLDVAGCERSGLSGGHVRSTRGRILRTGGGARRSRRGYPSAGNHI